MKIAEKHRQLVEDYKTILEIGHVYDETGGWLPDEQIQPLLFTPTKAQACCTLLSYLEHWFNTGIESSDRGGHFDTVLQVSEFIEEEPHLLEIAERWDIAIR